MKSFEQQLGQYAAYHRDPRNIATHFVGVPMILFAVIVLLSRPVLGSLGGLPVSPALLIAALAALYYLVLHRGTGALMTAILLVMLLAAAPLAARSTSGWLGWGLGCFVVGWIIQAIGHVFEGRKPAFFDDVVGLLIGPLFVLCEALFAAGLLASTRAAVERQTGPVARRPQPGATA
ncbi:MAG: DUF962 domain-containing protein [Lautropia sp.]